jgi:ATP-dependent Clp protease ATP-binding subunit ClpC
VLSQDEARALAHDYIGTEHLLLGLIREEEGIAARTLVALGVTLEDARFQVERLVGRGNLPGTGQIPFTPAAKTVLELSLREALALGHNHVGTEHLLLGLQREGKGVAIEVLAELGVSEEGARGAVLAALSGEPPARRERPQRRRPRWEYALVPVGSLESADVLEPLGRDGWELVALVGEPPELRAVLKRPG